MRLGLTVYQFSIYNKNMFMKNLNSSRLGVYA
nr:MAG TPA: hypothetical protein [Caudoviricetes sp.]